MNLNIKNKIALVTGGSNGIGEEISILLAKQGVNIVVTSRSNKNIIKLKKKINAIDPKIKVCGVVVNFLKINWETSFKKAIAKYKFDILVNNAGHNLEITNPYCSTRDWQKVLNLNFLNSVSITNMVIQNMKKKNWGRIVNISSVAAFENMGPVTYCVAKSSLAVYSHVMGRILASEKKNIVISCVLPGVVKTKNGHWSKVMKTNPSRAKKYLKERCPLGRFGTSEEIANVVLFYCSDLASFSQGSIVSVDGGQSRNYMSHTYL